MASSEAVASAIAAADRTLTLADVAGRLAEAHGHDVTPGDARAWWPGHSPFEIALGAVLVQHTRWDNAERALAALREARTLTPGSVLALGVADLEALIRPSGTYAVKARRLRALASWWVDTLPSLATATTGALRESLLKVHGVGPETADCILVYAFGRPCFIADAYARRLLARLGVAVRTDLGYEALRLEVERLWPTDAEGYAAFHAHVVEHGKRHCTATPRCEGCTLRAACRHAAEVR